MSASNVSSAFWVLTVLVVAGSYFAFLLRARRRWPGGGTWQNDRSDPDGGGYHSMHTFSDSAGGSNGDSCGDGGGSDGGGGDGGGGGSD
jgi:hypothetical protein